MSPSERIQLQKKLLSYHCVHIYIKPQIPVKPQKDSQHSLWPFFTQITVLPKTTQKQPQIRPRNQGWNGPRNWTVKLEGK